MTHICYDKVTPENVLVQHFLQKFSKKLPTKKTDKMYDVEKVIEYLKKEKGVTHTEIAKNLGVPRENMYAWKKSTNPQRLDELAQKLIETHREYLPEDLEKFKVEEEPEKKPFEEKYQRLLEMTVEELKEELKKLRKHVDSLTEQLLEALRRNQK